MMLVLFALLIPDLKAGSEDTRYVEIKGVTQEP
jgi:hypothetical protein